MNSRGRTYTREFKIEAAKLSYNSDKPVEEIAEQLGVSQSSQAFPGNGQRKERDEEVARLKKELREARMENEILKKAVAIFTRRQG